MRSLLILLLFAVSTIAQAQYPGSKYCFTQDTGFGSIRLNGLSDLQPPFTISAWVNVDAEPGINPIFNTSDLSTSGNFTSVLVFFETDSVGDFELVLSVGDYTGTNNHGNLEMRTRVNGIENEWTHFSLRMDTNYNGQVFINGIPPSVNDVKYYTGSLNSLNPPLNGDTRIGKIESNYFRGELDELRIWSEIDSYVDLHKNMCQRLSGNEPNLELYYRFDDDQNIIDDLSLNSRDGTRMGVGSNIEPSAAPIGDYSKALYGQGSVWVVNNLGDTLTCEYPSVTQNGFIGIHAYYCYESPYINGYNIHNCDSVGVFGRFHARYPGRG